MSHDKKGTSIKKKICNARMDYFFPTSWIRKRCKNSSALMNYIKFCIKFISVGFIRLIDKNKNRKKIWKIGRERVKESGGEKGGFFCLVNLSSKRSYSHCDLHIQLVNECVCVCEWVCLVDLCVRDDITLHAINQFSIRMNILCAHIWQNDIESRATVIQLWIRFYH